ncbi:MAG: hypothetical protein ABIJ91_00945 [Candidatus Kuenenbacteria bacterium]
MNQQAIKPLVLSFRTPPAVRPQSILIGKMINQWINQGLKPVIVTYDSNGDWNIDLDIYKIPQLRISRYLNNRYINRVYPVKFLLEDHYYRKMYKKIKGLVKKHNINLIYSFSNPIASNIIGTMLSKRLGIKFVASFSDPWYDSPLQRFTHLERRGVFKREKFIIENSNKVIFCNDVAQKLIMKKYPEKWLEKTAVIPHCFDLKDYPEVKNDKASTVPLESPEQQQRDSNDKFLISHIGAFYPERNPKPLFTALSAVLKSKPELKGKVKLNLIGGTSNYTGYRLDDLKNLLKSYNIEGIAEIIPPVEYKESLRQMKLSDLLIVIDANYAGSPFLTSKAIDYLGSGNPIIGITPKNSPTDSLLKNIGYQSFSYDEINELTNYLENIIKNKTKIKPNQDLLSQYDVKNTTKKLIGYFREII